MPQTETELIILGGGLAGISLAYFYQGRSIILEKEKQVGGLCRSFDLNGVKYDIGPHIIFSKNQAVLDWHRQLIPVNKLRRSNKIYHQGRFIPYPFENGLYALNAADKKYCLQTFLKNPYRAYSADTMQQFFLKTFGAGITNLYLRPYNAKIWKWDPAFLDTQMVARIPQPPDSDIIAAANGIKREGYLHQLHFYYPRAGGIASLVQAYQAGLREKSTIINSVGLKKIERQNGKWNVTTNRGVFRSRRLVNCLPLTQLICLINSPRAVQSAAQQLRHNSIHIVVVQVKKDQLGHNLAIMLASPDIIFHRLTKLNYLGSNYRLAGGGTTLLAEITFRPDLRSAIPSGQSLVKRVINDLLKLKFINESDVLASAVRTFDYAYIIYDLNHRSAVDLVLGYLKTRGIMSVGRFAEYAYINTDQVVEKTQAAARLLATKH